MTSKTTQKENKPIGLRLQGKVVSVKMKDTAVVTVNRYVRHPKYKKFVNISKRYKVHDPANTLKEGDQVTIVECAPISKDKHFKIAL